tara:strand:- start:81 stop:248 length:168 start_codon:yes stop_codon:yes gene_type:complete
MSCVEHTIDNQALSPTQFDFTWSNNSTNNFGGMIERNLFPLIPCVPVLAPLGADT